MITKAYIIDIIDKYRARVRIPIYNKAYASPTATPTDNLSIATICTLPGVIPNYKVGDVVYVAFEEDIVSKPVILGLLCYIDMEKSSSDATFSNMQVGSSAALPQQTSVGNVSSKEINTLKGVRGSIQNQIDIASSTGGGSEYPAITNAEIDSVIDGTYSES